MIRELLKSDLRRRREQTGLTQTEFALLAQLSLPTLERWEDELSPVKPPPFFELALRYVEQNAEQLRRELKPTKAVRRRTEARAGLGFRERFFAKTAKTETDCLAWLGAKHSVRLDSGDFVTPRKAAYLLKHGELPAQDVKLKCLTPNCVAWQHLTLGRIADSGVRRLDLDKAAVLADRAAGMGIKALARKYKCAIGTIYNIVGKNK